MNGSMHYTVVVRDREQRLRADDVDEWDALTLIASLSADPRSFDELRRAFLRYRPDQSLADWRWRGGADDEPDGGWLLIDMAIPRLVAGGGAELPEPFAAYEPDDDVDADADPPLVWIHLPPDWLSSDTADWQRALLPLPAPRQPLDVRRVLFGRALAEGIARRAHALAAQGELPAELPPPEPFDGPPLTAQQWQLSQRWHALTVQIHADWLMTPRDDLDGQTPRTFLHRGREWVDWELDRRQLQWTRERRPPRAIDRDTYAYRYGPLGRHEVVMYFELCRAIIAHAWQRLLADPAITAAALADALGQHADRWLSEPSDDEPLPPAHVIEHERRRLPLVGGGTPLDCDCPLCRMGAEGTLGPMFCGYDGHQLELEGEFAFSFTADREQWEREQEDRRRRDEAFEAEWRERERQQTADAADDFPDAPLDDVPLTGVWQRSMVDWESMLAPGVPAVVLTMGVGMLVAELVDDLKESGGDRQLINRMNRAFDEYRRSAGQPRQAAAAERELAAALESVAGAHRPLTAKAADLQSRLAELRLAARTG